MNYAFIIVTACVVSIDALIGGFALSLKNKLTFVRTLIIGLITFLMCLPCAILGGVLNDSFSQYVGIIGAVLFLVVGIVNIFSVKKELDMKDQTELERQKERKGWLDAVLVGIAVGFDAAIANLSISMMGNSSVWVCVIFAIAHIIFVGSNLILAKFNIVKHMKKVYWLPGIIMIGLAVYKLVEVFN